MIIWPSKDPQEVADYSWYPGLDTGDTITGFTATTTSTVDIDSTAYTDTLATAWLSGGTAGETAIFTLTVTTDGGRTFEQSAQIKITDSASQGITLERVKEHLRVDVTVDDTLITGYMAAAKAYIERYTAQPVVDTEVEQTFTAFGDYLELNRGPVNSITSIAYTDADGDPQTVSGARLSDGKVYPPTTGWPTIEAYSSIVVTYQAGFETTPPELDHAQLLLIGHWYENREAASERPPQEMALAVESLCLPFRLPTLR